MVKLSVITPIYDAAQFLDKCLQSLISQTLEDIEFIWIDNGASPKCREIINQYKEKRSHIKVISLEQNIGYGGAMNRGLEEATGEYIGFCDSDDWVDINFFEMLYQVACQDGSDMAYTCYQQEYGDRTLSKVHLTDLQIATDLVDKLRVLRDGAIWDKIFRTDLIKRNAIKFPAYSRSYYEDNIFLIQCTTKANAISLLDEPYYHYMQHQHSLMHNKLVREERRQCMRDVIVYILSYSEENYLLQDEKFQCLRFLARSIGISKAIKDAESYQKIREAVRGDHVILNQLEAIRRFRNPSLLQSLWSIQDDFQNRVLWVMGMKIKLKDKIDNNKKKE